MKYKGISTALKIGLGAAAITLPFLLRDRPVEKPVQKQEITEEIPYKTPERTPDNIVFTVKTPEDNMESFSYAWFGDNGKKYTLSEAQKIRQGDEIEFIKNSLGIGKDMIGKRYIVVDVYIEHRSEQQKKQQKEMEDNYALSYRRDPDLASRVAKLSSFKPQITDDFFKSVGYKLNFSNSEPKQAQVVMIGETHRKHEKEISDLLGHYVKDGDVVLIESMDKDFDTGSLLELGGSEHGSNFIRTVLDGRLTYITFKPDGAKIGGKTVKLKGADDDDLIIRHVVTDEIIIEELEDKDSFSGEKSEDQLLGLMALMQETTRIMAARDGVIYSSIAEAIKDNPGRKIFLIAGSKHIRDGRIAADLDEKGIRYASLDPLDNKFGVR